MKTYSFLFFFIFVLASCGSPLVNEAKQESPQSKKEQIQNVGDQNLLQARGCPIKFNDIPLCAEVLWFDDQTQPVDGPIYWEEYWNHEMSALLYFWNSKDGWPIDPREEFEAVEDIRVKLFMPTHGHGSDFPVVEELQGRTGQFRVSGIRFIMGGGSVNEDNPWEVRIQLNTKIMPEDDSHDPEDRNLWSQKILKFYSTENR